MYGGSGVERNGEIGYLQAYSGQIADEGEDFVPAVFDYLQPDGYFKTHEAEITQLNQKIAQTKSLNSLSTGTGKPKIDSARGRKRLSKKHGE